jgi:cell division protein FtsI (penicillin-binding protein 3)
MIRRWLSGLIKHDERTIDTATGEPAAAPAAEAWRTGMKGRSVIVLIGLAVWAVGIEARLVQLQVFQHKELAGFASRQQRREVKQTALRGDIVDRRGEILAYSVMGEQVYADPSDIDDPAKVARALCQAFRDCTAKELADLTTRLSGQREYALVRHANAVTPDQIARAKALKLKSVGFMAEAVRYYPNFEMGAHVLGFVGNDDKGLGGVESAFDSDIRGQEGLVLIQQDAHKTRMETRVERAPTPGATLELSIDLKLQYIAERELRLGVDANRAKAGTAIIMDPQSGEILALANYPTFNPNNFGRYSEDDRRNRAVQDVYEPGSTFKIVTASAAIQEGVVAPTDLIDTNPGYITLPGNRIVRDTHHIGVATFEDVIVNSSNVGAIKTGLRVGADRMSRYVHRFGFGEAIGEGFPGESAGRVYSPDRMDESALGSMSMGYQISVTPLQMATAASAVANGGHLFEPHVVRAYIRDGKREPVAPKMLREAITAETAATLTTIMEGVVERGTAKAAKLDRYQAAGKTGTAGKVINGHYSKSEYNSSFVGFAPSRRPALTVIVVIDTPSAGQIYGGAVAAPVFKRIMTAALQYLGVPPTLNPVPPVLITTSTPTAPPATAKATLIPAIAELGGRTLMPDVRGMAMRDALRVLGRVGLSVRAAGDGVVMAQTPEPGEAIESGGWSALQLRRNPELPTTGGTRK